jgi:AcrR family transcriptional regulator
MLEIAQAAGLRQSSLYYWFRRKELIVAEILQQVNRLPLTYVRTLEARGGTADVQLWRFVRFDVRTVCGFPLEITEIHRFSERDPEAFATYWAERRALTEAVAAMVGRGVQEGRFREVDAYLCALTVIAQDESVQNWYPRAGVHGGAPVAGGDPAAARYRPEQIAELVADQTVGGLLARPSRLAALRRAAIAEDGEA